jgi:Zn-dependent metalloprotease/chitodextrinase
MAQNGRPKSGKKHPSFIKLDKKVNKNQTKQLFKKQFGLKLKDDLVLADQTTDELGFTHDIYQQYYDGIKVEGARYKVHARGGQIEMLSGNFRDVFEDLNTRPGLSEQAAFNSAKNHVGASRYIWDEGGEHPTGELVIVADPNGHKAPKLAYKFDIYALAPLSRADIYIDAHSGAFIEKNEKIHEADVPATGTSLYNGNLSFTADDAGSFYRLRQSADGNGIETYSLNNGTNYNNATDVTSSTTNFTSDNTAVQAHWGAEQTHKYYLQNHNRNSYNGAGAVIRSYVHYSSNYVNAFWDGQRMTYGDGDGVNYGPLVSLDIVSHEITHGVTEYSANLVYSYESGALNESFSDIFGEAVENFATGSNDWQMGTDIGIGGSGAIRSMDNPNAFNDPDTYGGTYWYTGTGDNGGVHINSGVQNKWFYILSAGESGTNDLGNSYSVTGIGVDKAAAIAYRNLSVYLSTNSQYADARVGAIQSAIDLYGAGSAEEIATTNAWYAVGVGGEYGSLSYCNSRGNNSSYEWIASVSVGSFSNSSGNNGGYGDFTGQTVNVTAGQSYNISLSPGFGGTVYNEYWKIWIDYNADGDFNDAGELAFDAGGLSSTTVNGSITIPSGASGDTRMRVSMKWDGAQTACETFSYGEVEDYTISIGSAGPDTQAPSTPGSLSASGTTTNSTNLSWTASSDNVGVTGYRVYVNGSFDGSTASTNYTVTGLSASTSYVMEVSAVDAAGNESGKAATNVTTLDPPDTQDPSTPGNLSASGTTSSSTNLSWTASSDNVGVTGYDVYVDGSYEGSTAGTNYAVNGLAASTTYTMQVVAKDAAGNTSSPASVNVTTLDPPADTQAPTTPGNLSASNTSQTSTDLSWTASSDNVGVTGYDVYVDGNYDGSTAGTGYSVTGLTASTTYLMEVIAKDAAGNSSSPASINVTTQSAGGGSTTLSAHYFESGWDGWQDGGSDCYRYYGSASWEGNYSIRLRDNSGIASAMTSSTYDVSGYSQLEVEFYFYPSSMETGEDFWLRYYDGSSWNTVAAYASGSSFNNGSFYVATVNISSANYNFPTNAQFRFQCDASANQDLVYIDAVTITGINGTAQLNTLADQTRSSIRKLETVTMASRPSIEAPGMDEEENMPLFEGLSLSPNPVRQQMKVTLPQNATSLRIISLNGALVRELTTPEKSNLIDVSDLQAGMYLLQVQTPEEVYTEKFIKQ